MVLNDVYWIDLSKANVINTIHNNIHLYYSPVNNLMHIKYDI